MALIAGHFKIYSLFPDIIVGTKVIFSESKIQVVLTIFIMDATMKSHRIQNFLKLDIFQILGKLSFPIYLLHLFFIGTISCEVMKLFKKN